jgi:PAS domain S-box-containing protein
LAFVAAKLGLGYGLFDLKNSVTKTTSAFFEPALDYVVCKIPRWDLGKFHGVDRELGSSMKSVGEVMAIGRTFEEAIQKGLRMIGQGMHGFVENKELVIEDVDKALREPTDKRIFVISKAMRAGYTVDQIHELTKIDKWFLQKLQHIMDTSKEMHEWGNNHKQITDMPDELLRKAKVQGFSDFQIARAIGYEGDMEDGILYVRNHRKQVGVLPVVKQIDTLAAEYPAQTNYLYLTYSGVANDVKYLGDHKSIVVLGSGAYRIGSSVEFDWCGVQALQTIRKEGYRSVMINYNPETVSTDYDMCDRLYFDELTFERDISERVATQQNLEIFKRVLDKVSDSILAVSADGTLVYANRQFIEEYGVKEELGTQKVYDLSVSLNTKEIFDKRVQEIRDNGGNFAYRAQYTRVGETKLRVHQVSAFMIQNQGEEMIWFFTQDITDVIKNRDELRELNYLMDAILNNIPVYLFVKDPEDDFRYLYWNKAFASHSKIPASKALGHTDFEVFPEHENAEKFHRDDLELIRTRERMEMQETYVTATGETRIVQTLKTLVPLEGRAPLIIGISWDITNMQNIEQELVQARIKAEQSDRLKTAFLANMSHEIRTPLNAIVGFSRLMTIADNAEDEKLYSDIINQNSEILLQLINDILDLAKIEAGTLEYIRYPMDLGELCRNVYEMHKDRVQTGVVLILDNKDTSLIINEDQNRIMQVVTNLITNAIKFTFKGEIRFGFEVREEYIDFYVKDTGMGISEEKIKMIFERFVKLNTFVQGTGLGLAICRVIVEKLGGEITAESKLNEGSTFRFTIPYKAGKKCPESEKATKCPESGSTEPRKVLQRRTVLVAEDVDSNFLLLKTLLGKRCNLLWAKNGEDAVNQFKEHQPDLILMDIKMPHMDGLEATRLIRSYSKEVPIVALTAFAFEPDKDRAIEAGCDDCLTKPVSQNALEKVLDKYVK